MFFLMNFLMIFLMNFIKSSVYYLKIDRKITDFRVKIVGTRKRKFRAKMKRGLGPKNQKFQKTAFFRKTIFFFSRNFFREILTPKSKIFRFFGAEPLFIFARNFASSKAPPLGAREISVQFEEKLGPEKF